MSYQQHLKIQITSKMGLGTFTTIDIPSQSVIMEITGDIFTKEKASQLPNFENFLQISHDLFQGPSGTVDDTINHSCDPNSYLKIVGNRVLLTSLYVIKAGKEITFDYSTSSTDDPSDWQMNCLCGSNICRRIISGFQHLSIDIQEEYKKKNIIPMFLRHNIFIRD